MKKVLFITLALFCLGFANAQGKVDALLQNNNIDSKNNSQNGELPIVDESSTPIELMQALNTVTQKIKTAVANKDISYLASEEFITSTYYQKIAKKVDKENIITFDAQNAYKAARKSAIELLTEGVKCKGFDCQYMIDIPWAIAKANTYDDPMVKAYYYNFGNEHLELAVSNGQVKSATPEFESYRKQLQDIFGKIPAEVANTYPNHQLETVRTFDEMLKEKQEVDAAYEAEKAKKAHDNAKSMPIAGMKNSSLEAQIKAIYMRMYPASKPVVKVVITSGDWTIDYNLTRPIRRRINAYVVCQSKYDDLYYTCDYGFAQEYNGSGYGTLHLFGVGLDSFYIKK